MATRKPSDAATTFRLLSRRVAVLIDRGMTDKTPRVVWQHELPILEAVFGEGKVTPIESDKLDEGHNPRPSPDMLVHNKRQDAIRAPSVNVGIGHVFVGDPRAEYDRLGAVYGRHPDIDMLAVEHVYGRFQGGRFAEMVGEPELEDLPDDQVRALVRAWGGAPEDVTFKATDDERRAAAAAIARFNALAGAELLQLARDVGVTLR